MTGPALEKIRNLKATLEHLDVTFSLSLPGYFSGALETGSSNVVRMVWPHLEIKTPNSTFSPAVEYVPNLTDLVVRIDSVFCSR